MTPIGSPNQTPEEPWNGDHIFVMVEIITLVLGFLMAGMMMPFALGQMQSKSGAQMTGTTIQNTIFGILGCTMVIVIAIEAVIMTGLWKGKLWAYVVLTIMLLCGGLSQVSNLGRTPQITVPGSQVLIGFGLIMSIGKLAFCGLRLAGAVGPPLK